MQAQAVLKAVFLFLLPKNLKIFWVFFIWVYLPISTFNIFCMETVQTLAVLCLSYTWGMHLIVGTGSSHIDTDIVVQDLALELCECCDDALECGGYVGEVGNTSSCDQHLWADDCWWVYSSKSKCRNVYSDN